VLTPFEKNLEVWRQLWRVLERSDVVVQVGWMHLLGRYIK
jgi:ribosome biogenesis GTPase A